eukprot:TRINITY_DN9187_c0_g1_i2.p1 TRINITY_DN9187_c0_g1~~TRINITY_DN9187_c0_g1_i2.p1  ORF type:complete len:471 (-),score=87.66 TRINITY_DN9187_c0_g1_i2:139-1551(-)
MQATCWWCLAWLRLASGQIRIMAPETLVQEFAASEGRIDGSTATFGAPFYGERILGQLVYGESTLHKKHCSEDDYTVPEPVEYRPSGKSYTEVRLIHIVLVERGTCSFVTKAHAVIIVDKEGSTKTPKQIRDTIVADDGWGSTVDIPSILISREEGQKLIKATRRGQVVVELAWDVPSDHVVVMDMWMSSASAESVKFLKDFMPKRAALGGNVKFVPHYHVFSMSSSQDYNDLCTDETARYCAEDPDRGGSVTGRMVLTEDVRQLCIHDVTAVPQELRTGLSAFGVGPGSVSSKWWSYVSRFLEQCPVEGTESAHAFGTECAEKLMHQLGIDVDKVNKCVIQTQEQKLQRQQENVAWSPRALRINGWRYSGAMDADLVTRAVCAGFIEKPDACARLVEPVNPFLPWQDVKTPDGVTFSKMLEMLGGVAAVSICAGYFYKRSLASGVHATLREEVMLEVQSQMATYKQLGT